MKNKASIDAQASNSKEKSFTRRNHGAECFKKILSAALAFIMILTSLLTGILPFQTAALSSRSEVLEVSPLTADVVQNMCNSDYEEVEK